MPVTLGTYNFTPEPVMSEGDNIEELEVGTVRVSRHVRSFSLEGHLLAPVGGFATMMTRRLELSQALLAASFQETDFTFGDGITYRVKVRSFNFESGTWTNDLPYSVELETIPTFQSTQPGPAIVSAAVSESHSVEYINTDAGRIVRKVTTEWSVNGQILITDLTATNLSAQRNAIKAQLNIESPGSIAWPTTFMGITGQLNSLSFEDPSPDGTQQGFSVSINRELYLPGEVQEINRNDDRSYEYFGNTNDIVRTTFTYNFEGTIYTDPTTVPTDPTANLVTGSDGTVTYGGVTGRLASSGFNFNPAEYQGSFSFQIVRFNLLVRRYDKIDVSRSVTYITEQPPIVEKIESTFTLNGSLTDPNGVSDPTLGVDPDVGDITFGIAPNQITGQVMSWSFTPTEDGREAQYQVQVKTTLRKRLQLVQKLEKSVSYTRGADNRAQKAELSKKYSGEIRSDDGTILTETELDTLMPFAASLPPVNAQEGDTLFNGEPVRSTGYTLDAFGIVAQWNIETSFTRLVNLPPGFPDGVIDFEVKTSVTPSFDRFVAIQIVDLGEVFQLNGSTTGKQSVSGFFVGQTLAIAQSAADALRLNIPSNAVPQNFNQTIDERANRVDFSYEVALPVE